MWTSLNWHEQCRFAQKQLTAAGDCSRCLIPWHLKLVQFHCPRNRWQWVGRQCWRFNFICLSKEQLYHRRCRVIQSVSVFNLITLTKKRISLVFDGTATAIWCTLYMGCLPKISHRWLVAQLVYLGREKEKVHFLEVLSGWPLTKDMMDLNIWMTILHVLRKWLQIFPDSDWVVSSQWWKYTER